MIRIQIMPFSDLEALLRLLRELDVSWSESADVTVDGNGAKWLKHYCSSHKILLVGEGDFSFSACLARAFGDATNIIATSLDPFDFVISNYSKGKRNIETITDKGGKVIHQMDARNMSLRFDLESLRFDRIVYNFPHAGFVQLEARSSQIQRQRKLILQFFINAKSLLANGGQVHIVHKTNSFFAEWRVEDLATLCGLSLVEKTDFELEDYPGYRNKYGFGGDKNFDCNPSMTYKFCVP